jgi:hypothetical protein
MASQLASTAPDRIPGPPACNATWARAASPTVVSQGRIYCCSDRSRMSSRCGEPVLARSSLCSLKVDTAFRRAVPRSSIFTAVRGGSGCGSTRRSSIATRIQRGPPDRSHIQRGARVAGPRQLIHCAQLRHAAGRICRRISRCWRPSPDRRGGVRATARRRRSAHARRGGRRDLRHGPGSRPRRR